MQRSNQSGRNCVYVHAIISAQVVIASPITRCLWQLQNFVLHWMAFYVTQTRFKSNSAHLQLRFGNFLQNSIFLRCFTIEEETPVDYHMKFLYSIKDSVGKQRARWKINSDDGVLFSRWREIHCLCSVHTVTRPEKLLMCSACV